ncbi:hypothetical protein Q5424_20870, partial [Conexibacter sp. JD483]
MRLVRLLVPLLLASVLVAATTRGHEQHAAGARLASAAQLPAALTPAPFPQPAATPAAARARQRDT